MRVPVSLMVAGALCGLSACQKVDDQVFQRLASPDGKYEAVMMVCPMPSDPAIPEMVVAVFKEKGRDCEQPYVHAETGVNMSHPFDDGAHATMRWDGETLVVTSQGERQYYSGTFMGEHRNIIRLEGRIVNMEQWNGH